MKITKKENKESTQLIIRGRLDAYWADHLSRELDKVIRQGAHHLVLDLSHVTFMSSAGIGILIKYYKLLIEMSGSLSVSALSKSVEKVLQFSGLADYLVLKPKKRKKAPDKKTKVIQFRKEGVDLEIFNENKNAGLQCRLVGNPDLMKELRVCKKDVHLVQFTGSAFGIGLGCFGTHYRDCRRRFGEFLAVSGTAAYLPTDGTHVPDYMVASKAFIPELRVPYGIVCEGTFSHQIRFQIRKNRLSIGFTQLINLFMEITKCQTVGLVILAEAEGLVGAALRQSPALKSSSDDPFAHPLIRKWFTFTSERAYQHHLALIAGIADLSDFKQLKSHTRPLDCKSRCRGHFHSLVFSYCHLGKGRLNLRDTVHHLFDTERLHDLLHLINDDRNITGVGQSEFIRGNCWMAAIDQIE